MIFLAEASHVSLGVDSTTLSVLSVRSRRLLRVSCRLVGHPGCLAFDRPAGHRLNDHPVDSVRGHAGRRPAGPRPFHRLAADLDLFLCRLPNQSSPFLLIEIFQAVERIVGPHATLLLINLHASKTLRIPAKM